MSVEHTTLYGYGYVVNKEDYAGLQGVQWDYFVDSVYTRCINSSKEYPYYFFGLYTTVDEGEFLMVKGYDNMYSHVLISTMMDTFRRIFPHRNGDNAYLPRHYVISAIE